MFSSNSPCMFFFCFKVTGLGFRYVLSNLLRVVLLLFLAFAVE